MDLKFYTINVNYCEYLRTFDSNVPLITNNKSNRVFIGVLLNVYGIKYFAPLSSPKPKHKTMNDKYRLDLVKINKGKLGIINICNMIPISSDNASLINFKINNFDTISTKQYKQLLREQYNWCKTHQTEILNKAKVLYQQVTKDIVHYNLKTRCCNFKLLEQKCKEYNKIDSLIL